MSGKKRASTLCKDKDKTAIPDISVHEVEERRVGTGTASGAIVSDNVTALHLINIKRIAYESRPWRDIYDL